MNNIILGLIMLVLLISSCSKGFKSVKIGEQEWMTENLNVDRLRNGDPLPEAKTEGEWKRASENNNPSWCYYNNDPTNGEKYGKLYNWHAVNDSRGLAPEGWHLPSDDEWTTLTAFLAGKGAGTKMKSTSGWKEDGNGTNESGFTGLPGGYRNSSCSYYDIGRSGFWWASTQANSYNAWYRNLYYDFGNVTRSSFSKYCGFSVRCLKD